MCLIFRKPSGQNSCGELDPRLRTDGGFVEVVGTECVRGDESGV